MIWSCLQVSLLYKAGITSKDVESKKAAPLYAGSAKRSATMALQMLKRPDLAPATKARFEQQVADAEKYNGMRAPL